MRPLYVALVWLVAAVHFAFLAYLPIGGFLALRWRRSIWLHIAVAMWGLGSVALHLWCPLTSLEQWARARAGMGPLVSTGFIDHHFTGVLFPAEATGFVQAVVLVAVLGSWAAYLVTARVRRPRDVPPRIDMRNFFPE